MNRVLPTIVILGITMLTGFGDEIEEGAQPAKLQRRLAALELEILFFYIDNPFAKDNPQFNKKKKEMEVLSRLSGIRSLDYRAVLNEKRREIEAQTKMMRDGNLGADHPIILRNKDKIAVIDALLKEKR